MGIRGYEIGISDPRVPLSPGPRPLPHPADLAAQPLAINLVKDVFQIVDIFEIIDLIVVVFGKHFFIDQIKNDMSEILGLFNPPIAHHRKPHRAEAFHDQLLDAFQQLFAGDMLGALVFALGKTQGLHHKEIRVLMVTRIFQANQVNHVIYLVLHDFILPRIKRTDTFS